MSRGSIFRRGAVPPRRRRSWPLAPVSSILSPQSIPTAESFGTPGVQTGLKPTSIASAESFGLAVISITLVPTIQPVLARRVATYELVCVARIMQTSGPPTFVEVDPIPGWTGLSYTGELSRPSQLNVGVKLETITEPIRQRLRDLARLATELWLYRNGRLVFAGPLLGFQRQNQAVTLQAAGLLHYLRWWIVWSDLVYSQVDQFTIATNLVDHWQNLDYGNFGIDTSGVGLSGVVRDATYLKTELHPIGQRVEEMGKRENGFDVAVDPATRALQLWYPQQGVDRSTGPDSLVIDEASLTNQNIVCSAGPGDLASEAFGTGTSNQDIIYSTASNLELRASFGRTGVAATFEGVSEQTTADAHTQGLLDARGAALLIPGPDARVTIDSDLTMYGVGDTIDYESDNQLGVGGPVRIRRRTVTVAESGKENVTLEPV